VKCHRPSIHPLAAVFIRAAPLSSQNAHRWNRHSSKLRLTIRSLATCMPEFNAGRKYLALRPQASLSAPGPAVSLCTRVRFLAYVRGIQAEFYLTLHAHLR
jgi:hypothetical protein